MTANFDKTQGIDPASDEAAQLLPVSELAEYRKFFHAAEGRELDLDDVQLRTAILMQDDDRSEEEWVEIFKAHEKLDEDEEILETSTPSVSAVTAEKLSAWKLAEKIADDPELDRAAKAFVKAVEITKMAPALFGAFLQRHYSKEELAAMPMPGSRKTDKDGRFVTNNPDYYSHKIGGENVKGSWWQDFVARLHFGAELFERKQKLEHWRSDEGRKDAPQEYKGDSTKIALELDKIKRRIGSLVRAMRRAYLIVDQFQKIRDLLPRVEADYIWDDDERTKVTEAEKCIIIMSKARAGKMEFLTVTQFISLDPAKALANGGTYEALVETLSREPKKTSTQGEGLIVSTNNVEMVLSSFNVFADSDANVKALIAACKNPKNTTLVMAVGRAWEELTAIYEEIGDAYSRAVKIEAAKMRKADRAAATQEAATKAASAA
jgi:hypothetical protein